MLAIHVSDKPVACWRRVKQQPSHALNARRRPLLQLLTSSGIPRSLPRYCRATSRGPADRLRESGARKKGETRASLASSSGHLHTLPRPQGRTDVAISRRRSAYTSTPRPEPACLACFCPTALHRDYSASTAIVPPLGEAGGRTTAVLATSYEPQPSASPLAPCNVVLRHIASWNSRRLAYPLLPAIAGDNLQGRREIVTPC